MKLYLPLNLRAALLFSAAFFSNHNLYAEVTLTDNPTIWTEEGAPGYTSDDWFSASGIVWEIRFGSYATTGGAGPTTTPEWPHTSFQLGNGSTLTMGEQASLSTVLSLPPETQYNMYESVELMSLTQDSSLVNHGKLTLEAEISR